MNRQRIATSLAFGITVTSWAGVTVTARSQGDSPPIDASVSDIDVTGDNSQLPLSFDLARISDESAIHDWFESLLTDEETIVLLADDQRGLRMIGKIGSHPEGPKTHRSQDDELIHALAQMRASLCELDDDKARNNVLMKDPERFLTLRSRFESDVDLVSGNTDGPSLIDMTEASQSGDAAGGVPWTSGAPQPSSGTLGNVRRGSRGFEFNPLEGLYFLDWPWSSRRGHNMFYWLVGPPVFVFVMVGVLGLMNGLNRRPG